MPSSRRAAAVLGGLTLITGGLAVVATAPANANPAGTDLVISEVYGAGHNSANPYNADFVELYNPTDAPINLDGRSLQYRSSGSTSAAFGANLVKLPDVSVAAGDYYLVSGAGATGGTPLPEPDLAASFNASGTSGQVLLASTAAGFIPTSASDGRVIDFVGYGAANLYEGSAPALAASNSTSVGRDLSRTQPDTDDNGVDFNAGAPGPQNSSSEGGGGGGDPEEPPSPSMKTIAEIQGPGAASPLSGDTVTTRGVVTADWETGGFASFTIQTPAVGPGEASHGLYVYNASAGAAVAPGDYVEVTGKVSEFRGLTEITPASAPDVTKLSEELTVTPTEVAWPSTDEDRERLESMVVMPQGDLVVTDNYSTNRYGEIGLAADDEPLRQPTDVGPVGSEAYRAAIARNEALLVTLDDGASIDFLPRGGGANQDIPLPWLTSDPTIRVGEAATFVKPVIVDYRFGLWRFQPTAQLTADDENRVLPAQFGDTRTAHPAAVGGDIQISSFNVLNYFTTTGEDWVASGSGTCSYYLDRDDDPVTDDRCNPDGPRGAAEQEDLERQQAKIVSAINALGAEVVSLEEIENGARFGRDRDAAMADLVAALNADAGAGTWAFVPSPETVPVPEREDVIRTGFIYKPSVVVAQGDSFIYDGPEFDNARDPVAQVFKPKAGNSKDKFLVIVNHFKSKSSACAGEVVGPQGNCNGARVEQAKALVGFADELKSLTNVKKVYLDGDFNSYTFEDPMRVLYDAGYLSLGEEFDAEESYLFRGLVGSLDHGLANRAALGTTSGATVWTINAFESVALEYSRHNYNATNFYEVSPFRSSDHNPVVIGVNVTQGR